MTIFQYFSLSRIDLSYVGLKINIAPSNSLGRIAISTTKSGACRDGICSMSIAHMHRARWTKCFAWTCDFALLRRLPDRPRGFHFPGGVNPFPAGRDGFKFVCLISPYPAFAADAEASGPAGEQGDEHTDGKFCCGAGQFGPARSRSRSSVAL